MVGNGEGLAAAPYLISNIQHPAQSLPRGREEISEVSGLKDLLRFDLSSSSPSRNELLGR